MTQENQLAKQDRVAAPLAHDDGEYSIYLDASKFEQAQRAANLICKSDLVPEHFKNKPQNCLIVFDMAQRLGAQPIMLMQKTYIIKGRPAMEAQLVIALVNSRGPFTGPIQWKFNGEGDNRACTAYATHKVTKQVCDATVTWKMAKLEGWTSKQGSKWLTMPDQMFMYRSATFLARLHCPEVLFGFPTVEELQDIGASPDGLKTSEVTELPVSALEDRLSPKKRVESTVTDEPSVPKTDKGTHWTDTGEPKEEEPVFKPVEEPPADTIADEERYYCKDCGAVFGKRTKGKKLLCRSCLSDKVVDRLKENKDV